MLSFHTKWGTPDAARWGRPASPGPAGLGVASSGADLLWMAWIVFRVGGELLRHFPRAS